MTWSYSCRLHVGWCEKYRASLYRGTISTYLAKIWLKFGTLLKYFVGCFPKTQRNLKGLHHCKQWWTWATSLHLRVNRNWDQTQVTRILQPVTQRYSGKRFHIQQKLPKKWFRDVGYIVHGLLNHPILVPSCSPFLPSFKKILRYFIIFFKNSDPQRTNSQL